MAAVELNGTELREFIKAEYAVIDCYGDNCSACVLLEPVFDALADELSGISFGRINITEHSLVAEEYAISAMPTLLLFRKGELVNRFLGYVEREELLSIISDLLYQ